MCEQFVYFLVYRSSQRYERALNDFIFPTPSSKMLGRLKQKFSFFTSVVFKIVN